MAEETAAKIEMAGEKMTAQRMVARGTGPVERCSAEASGLRREITPQSLTSIRSVDPAAARRHTIAAFNASFDLSSRRMTTRSCSTEGKKAVEYAYRDSPSCDVLRVPDGMKGRGLCHERISTAWQGTF